MADTTTELEVLDQIVDVLGGQSGQHETVVPVLQQIKELLASGITDPESIAEAVVAWLDEHPEATTTVQDGSITVMKLAQDVIGLLNDKADIDGYYSQLTAGLAENLIGRGDAVPAEYLYRTAGGTADIEDGIATIDCINGNTLVWNQLGRLKKYQQGGSPCFGNQLNNWTVSQDGRSASVSNTAVPYLAYYAGQSASHKILLRFDLTASGTFTHSVLIGFSGNNVSTGVTLQSGVKSSFALIGVYANNTTGLYIYPAGGSDYSVTCDYTLANFQLFDLTLMFGAGNEPSTVAEFEEMYPKAYYPYSAPKLLPVDIRGIETVGFNAYNPSTGEAELLGGHQYQISGTYTSLSYSTGESIALDSDGIFTPSENGTLTVTGGNATDTCVHLVWSGYRNGEYEKHWSEERAIDTSRFFPTGMKKAGDKADALYADHYDTVIGAVDLGTLTWTAYSGGFYSYAIADALAGSATNRYDHITCAPYTSQNVASLSELSDKCCSIDSGRYIQVKDSSYTEAADFKAAMSGVILYYELATPTTTEIDPPLNLSYKVSDFGTERIMVDETADVPQSAPVPMEVEYGINAIDTIRRLPKEYQSHKSMGQLTAALESSLGVDITETWDETEQRYEYEVSDFEIADDSIPDAMLVQTGGVLERVDTLTDIVTVPLDYSGIATNKLNISPSTNRWISNNNYVMYYVKVPDGARLLTVKANTTSADGTAFTLLSALDTHAHGNAVAYATGWAREQLLQGDEGTYQVPDDAVYLWFTKSISGVDREPAFIGFNVNLGSKSAVYVGPSGNDANDGSFGTSAVATIDRALELGAETVLMLGGEYSQTVDLSKATHGTVNIVNATKTERVLIKAPDCLVAESETAVSGYTKVYSVATSKTFADNNVWLFQDGVPDASTEIADGERMPEQRGKQYRCDDTVIKKSSAATLEEALLDIENSVAYKWYIDNGVLYFSRPTAVTSANPICGSFNRRLFANNSRKNTLHLAGVDVKYMTLNVDSTTLSVLTDCSCANVFGEGCFTFDGAVSATFVRCEASRCFAGTNGDGFNAHSVNMGDAFAKQTTATFVYCWAHDNNDDGLSTHDRSEFTVIGGLYERNYYGGGVTPSNGAHCTCNGVLARHNGEGGFLYMNPASSSEGGVGGQMKCVGCVSDSNTANPNFTSAGYKINSAGNKGIMISCKAINESTAYYVSDDEGAMTLIDCGALDCTATKGGKTANITVKNTTIVS